MITFSGAAPGRVFTDCAICAPAGGQQEVQKRSGEMCGKKREMKEGPTMLLITKGRFFEPTMFMKIR